SSFPSHVHSTQGWPSRVVRRQSMPPQTYPNWNSPDPSTANSTYPSTSASTKSWSHKSIWLMRHRPTNVLVGLTFATSDPHRGRAATPLVPCRHRAGCPGLRHCSAGVLGPQVQVPEDVPAPCPRPAARLARPGVGVPLLDPTAPDELQQFVMANPQRPLPVSDL